MDVKKILIAKELCNDNEYLNLYCDLIEKNINIVIDKKSKYRYNRHHIIPRYYYTYNNLETDNSNSNLIYLSFIDHIKAHYYLFLCSTNERYKLANFNSLRLLLNKKDENFITIQNIILDENELNKFKEEYEKCCKLRGEQNAKNMKGRIHIKRLIENDLYEYKLVKKDELNFYLTNGWQKGAKNHDENWKIQHSKQLKGHITTEEQRLKLSIANKISQNTSEALERKSRVFKAVRNDPIKVEQAASKMRGELSPTKRSEVRKKMSDSAKRRCETQEFKDRAKTLNAKRIVFINENNEIIMEFISIMEASRYFNVHHAKIRYAIKNNKKLLDGYWREYKEWEKLKKNV